MMLWLNPWIVCLSLAFSIVHEIFLFLQFWLKNILTYHFCQAFHVFLCTQSVKWELGNKLAPHFSFSLSLALSLSLSQTVCFISYVNQCTLDVILFSASCLDLCRNTTRVRVYCFRYMLFIDVVHWYKSFKFSFFFCDFLRKPWARFLCGSGLATPHILNAESSWRWTITFPLRTLTYRRSICGTYWVRFICWYSCLRTEENPAVRRCGRTLHSHSKRKYFDLRHTCRLPCGDLKSLGALPERVSPTLKLTKFPWKKDGEWSSLLNYI